MVETEPTAERKIRQQEALILSQLIKAKRGCIIWQKCAEQLLEYLLWVLSRRDAWSLRQYTNTTRLEPEANPTRTRRLTSDYSSKQTLTSDYSSNPRADYKNEPVTPPPPPTRDPSLQWFGSRTARSKSATPVATPAYPASAERAMSSFLYLKQLFRAINCKKIKSVAS